ncbi:MAG: hypothetical protein KY461_10130 [Actinobacteria bacterium]|nr:hypothetical protein [Actinomycetota bacterium]
MAADRRPGAPASKFDRVRPPVARPSADRDQHGKEALYSTAPGAAPSSQVLVACARCDVESGINVLEFARTLVPPIAWNPLNGKLWARCPSCERRSWLRVRKGQALRALLDREPGGR